MINSFKNYLKLGKVRKKTPDSEESKALFQQSEERLEYTKDKKITDKTAKFILEDAYEAMREATQSLMSLKGFKPYSHEATISFLKEFYKDNFTEEEISQFDRFRGLRNNSVYKATKITEENAKDSLDFAEILINKIKSIMGK